MFYFVGDVSTVKFCFTINFVTLPFALYEIFYDYFSRGEGEVGGGRECFTSDLLILLLLIL